MITCTLNIKYKFNLNDNINYIDTKLVNSLGRHALILKY